MSILHCALEDGADLCLNERQKIHYRARSTEDRIKKKKNANLRIFSSHGGPIRTTIA